jgi:hypothetical protein
MEGKNNIVIYRDWISIFESLTDDEAGKLIKHFYRYVNDLNPEAPDRLTALLFEPIKQTLKRDLRKYESICLKNRDNVNIRWNKEHTTVYDRIRTDTKHTDRDRDRDRDREKDNDIKEDKSKKENRPPLEERQKAFFEEVGKHIDKYSADMCQAFFNYWAEPNNKGKMKWEMQDTWSLSGRLSTWAINDKKFAK